MKNKLGFIVALFLIALSGHGYSHQEETVRLLKIHSDVFYEQLLKLQSQIDSLSKRITILRFEPLLLMSHSHDEFDWRCIEPAKLDEILGNIEQLMKDLGDHEDAIKAKTRLYRQTTWACPERN